jgi:hypothetical protein
MPKDKGNVHFEVLQQNKRQNHCTIVEVWQDQPALEVHVMAAHTRQCCDKFQPMSGSRYNERLYKALDQGSRNLLFSVWHGYPPISRGLILCARPLEMLLSGVERRYIGHLPVPAGIWHYICPDKSSDGMEKVST